MFEKLLESRIQALSQVIDHVIPYDVFHWGPLTVTSTVVNTWVVMAILFAVVFLISRGLGEKPRGFQHVVEMLVEFVHGLIDDVMGRKGRKYTFIVGGVFLFIIFLNFSWFIPGMVPPTTDLSTTAALAVVTIILVWVMGVRERRAGFFKGLFEPTPPMVVMNVLEEVVHPFSLAVRLFGNIFGGDVVVLVLFALIPFVLPVPIMLLEVLMGFIQAFVFAMLTVVYLEAATEGHGH